MQPARGRLFTATETQPNSANVALLGYGLWQRRYLAQPLYGVSATNLLIKVNCASIPRELFEREFWYWFSTSHYATSAASHTCRIMTPGSVISDVSSVLF